MEFVRVIKTNIHIVFNVLGTQLLLHMYYDLMDIGLMEMYVFNAIECVDSTKCINCKE